MSSVSALVSRVDPAAVTNRSQVSVALMQQKLGFLAHVTWPAWTVSGAVILTTQEPSWKPRLHDHQGKASHMSSNFNGREKCNPTCSGEWGYLQIALTTAKLPRPKAQFTRYKSALSLSPPRTLVKEQILNCTFWKSPPAPPTPNVPKAEAEC